MIYFLSITDFVKKKVVVGLIDSIFCSNTAFACTIKQYQDIWGITKLTQNTPIFVKKFPQIKLGWVHFE